MVDAVQLVELPLGAVNVNPPFNLNVDALSPYTPLNPVPVSITLIFAESVSVIAFGIVQSIPAVPLPTAVVAITLSGSVYPDPVSYITFTFVIFVPVDDHLIRLLICLPDRQRARA